MRETSIFFFKIPFISIKKLTLYSIKVINMSTICPNCNSPYAYPTDVLMMCPECGHEWNPAEIEDDTNSNDVVQVNDANGNPLEDGDSVVIVKDLPVKGAPKPIKAGTKVKSIRLVEGDHNIDCKVPGFGAMALKSEFVKKA
jgi:protein PhnA